MKADGAHSTQSVTKTCIAAHDGFKTVTSKKWDTIAEDFPNLPALPPKSHKAKTITVRITSSLPVVVRKARSQAYLFLEIPLWLHPLTLTVCTIFKNVFDYYVCLHVSVSHFKGV
jgi:hypothetical protein